MDRAAAPHGPLTIAEHVARAAASQIDANVISARGRAASVKLHRQTKLQLLSPAYSRGTFVLHCIHSTLYYLTGLHLPWRLGELSTMADYNKQTVAQLRQLLKDRGIPSTGLTRKAQIVEKLEEADSADAGAPEASDAPADVATDAQEAEGADAQSAQEDSVPGPPLEEAGGMSDYFVEQAQILIPL